MGFEVPSMPKPEELIKKQVAPAEKSRNIVTIPQIDARNLGIDLTKIGGIDAHGMYSTVIEENKLKHLSDKINECFSDKDRTTKMLAELDESLEANEKTEPRPDSEFFTEDDKLSGSEAMNVLKDFLNSIQRGDDRTATSILKRAATPALQHAIVEARHAIQSRTWNKELPDVAFAFFELSEYIYISNHDGKRYETKKMKDEFEKIKERARTITIS